MRIIRRPELRALAIAAVAAVLAFSALFGLLIARTNTTQMFREQTSKNCETLNDLKARIRGTFMDARERALSSELDPAERAAINAAYLKEIARYRADECPTP